MLPLVSLLALVPGLGGLVEHGKAWLIESLAWLAIAVPARSPAPSPKHGQTLAARAERDVWKTRALQAGATAADNEASALAVGRQLSDFSDTFDLADAQARAEADRYTADLDAARTA
ncbi:hypothetical protein [Methylobacterium platani]|uniref:Uncharacterized protein n=2 Tax=Methylobacterium platani TaxID=427683 RepID=A0A179SBL8_9HYPH|nr:hypothetical protein [Methylobacterium platani]KMO16014.1 hypothetical protein SQ03_15705 [Methylobacterium platani JCM 14648]OAS24852.1 hypothetical protein A5481_12210 [Methylobacterium platani]